MLKIVLVVFIMSLNACAVVHHVQLGDVDDRTDFERFEVMASETAVSLPEAAHLTAITIQNKKLSGQARRLGDLIKLFQMGPSTGSGVFNEHYAEQFLSLILAACPSGKVSGVTSIREMRKYPIVSGQIVKLTGYCQKE